MNSSPRLAPVTRLRQAATLALRLAVGLVVGGFFHYLLYRLSLPAQPFIYVSF